MFLESTYTVPIIRQTKAITHIILRNLKKQKPLSAVRAWSEIHSKTFTVLEKQKQPDKQPAV